jgi:glutathione S-transferase
MGDLVLVGRSSSHFTRTARIFAIELGVPHAFRPVFEIMSLDQATFADNPALKIPILVDGQGSLFGTENICRELVRRSGKGAKVVMRGDVSDRLVANMEELTLHVMSSAVNLITAKLQGDSRPPPAKALRSIENCLRYLDDNVETLLAALPSDRALSFVEVTLYCAVTHLPFREVIEVDAWRRLVAFSRQFGEREGARSTEYRFDAK